MSYSSTDDVRNRQLLAVAEDQLTGFYPHPFDELAARCHMSAQEVLSRIGELLRAGIIRSIRQTLLNTQLTPGCLTAWQLPENRLQTAFEWLIQHDPFSGHVVLREPEIPNHPSAVFRLWTTLRLPIGVSSSVENHCQLVARRIGATRFVCMPAAGMFRLSVGHMRRAGLPPGTLDDVEPRMQRPSAPCLTSQQKLVLHSLRTPLSHADLNRDPWVPRAAAVGMSPQDFYNTAAQLVDAGLLGRFAVVLNHTHPDTQRTAGTAKAALLMWAVPIGTEERAGSICARHVCMTHCYFRSGSEPIGGTQIMGMVHGASRAAVRAHKSAIDAALSAAGIPLLHSQMLWTSRAHIRPSEQDPSLYHRWLNNFAR